MGKRLIHFLILLVTLCIGVGVPAFAHGHPPADIAIDAIDHGALHVETAPVDSNGEDRPLDSPGHVAPHHHCAADLVPEGSQPVAGFAIAGDALRPSVSAAMASRALAPPIEPPAA